MHIRKEEDFENKQQKKFNSGTLTNTWGWWQKLLNSIGILFKDEPQSYSFKYNG